MKEQTASNESKVFSAQFIARRKQRRRNRMLALLAVIAIGGGYYYWATTQVETEEAAEALVLTIDYGDIENAIPASGSLQPKEVVPIGAQASGRLEDILVEIGDFVQAGQVVAQIDARDQRLRVESSRLSLASQENQIRQREYDLIIAQRDLERTKTLHAAEAATDQELDNAEGRLISAETSLENLLISIEQSKTSLEQEEVQLEFTSITAPITGTIISLDQQEGATLNASQTAPTVMQVADLTTLTVETEISEADVAALATGVEVYFTTLGGGDRRWTGTLRKIDPMGTVSNNVVMFNGSFDVDNTDGELYPNMTTQVFFVTSSARNVLTVPIGALTYKDVEGQTMSQGMQPQGGRGEMSARFEEAMRNGDISPEMRAQIEERIRSGGGRGGFGGGDRGGGDGGGSGASLFADAITITEPRNATVELVREDGTIEVRDIVVGAMDRVNAEVISGLSQGDRIIAGSVIEAVDEDVDAVTSASR